VSVTIAEVLVAAPRQDRAYGSKIDLPTAGATEDAYSFDVAGWVVGKASPVKCVEVLHEGRQILEVAPTLAKPGVASLFPEAKRAERSGFRASIGALRLRPKFEILLRVRLEDGTRFPLGTVRGHREKLTSDHVPLVHPLMVNTTGRSGSAWLAWLLSCHPQIVAFEPFSRETRVATYWMTVLQELSEPNSYLAQFDPPKLAAERWWLGDAGVNRGALNDRRLRDWLGRRHIRSLAAMCQDQVERFYAENTDAGDGGTVTYFVEKFSPLQVTPDLLRELYPKAKEIILVRDFRDMFCSIRAFMAKRGQSGFGWDRTESEAEYIRSTMTGFARGLLSRWRHQEHSAHLLRYEDLVLQPAETLKTLTEYLDVDSSPETIEHVLRHASRDQPLNKDHQTAPDVRSSVGRWRTDLSTELIEICDETLTPLLAEFGYLDDRPSRSAATR
jgi:Sulfotransferase family